MKRTEFDGKQWILELINASPLKSAINGKVYKNRRPSDSAKEDIVINGVSVDNTWLQDGIFNVNIYVPYQQVKIDGTTQNMPNESRMKQLTDIAYPVFDEIYQDQFNLTIVRTEVIEEDKENANYINFRINLKAYPTI